MSTDLGDMIRFGNPLIDPVTGQALAAPATAFTTNGAATDPDGVELVIQRPDGTQLVYGGPGPATDGQLAHEGAGRFYTDVVMDQPGTWRYRLAGSGAVTAAAEGRIRVSRSRVAAS
jgi:hypothetical protein